MATYVTPKIKSIYQTVITAVRQDLGRTIYIHYNTGTPTTSDDDGFDPINQEPVDPNASLTYSETIYTITDVSIHWGPNKKPWLRLPGGSLEIGQAELSMNLSKVLIDPTDVNGETLFHNARKIVVDGIDCRVRSTIVKSGLGDLFTARVVVEKIEA